MSMVKDRPSAACRRRRSASSGMNRPIASSTSRSSWAGRTLCATWATWRSTYAAASSDRTMVARATRRARQAGRSPLTTRDQTRLEAVAELDGLAEVGLAGLGRQPDRGGELGHRELRDQRCTGSGDRHPGLAVVPHRGRLGQGVDRVHRRPGHRRLQLLGLRGIGRGRSSRPRELEHRGGGVEVGGAPCHDPNSSTEHRHSGPENGVLHRGPGNFFEKLFRPAAGPGHGPVLTSPNQAAWSRQARPPGGLRSWSRRARPPRVGVVSTRLDHRLARVAPTGPTTEGRRARPAAGHGVVRGLVGT